jgi:flagellar biosynthesis chaperone FliJ
VAENRGFTNTRQPWLPDPVNQSEGEDNDMKVNTRALLSAATIMLVLAIPTSAWAQHKHPQGGQKKPGMAAMKSEMARMMKSPHHMLMKTHLQAMAEFAGTLRNQAVKPAALDVDFARAAVAELRHNLDAIETLRQKHMQAMSAEMKAKMEAMSAEMKSKMQMMMEKMDKDRAQLKDQVSALETDVQADPANSRQVTVHTNALLKQLGMMLKMDGGNKSGKKKMEMKKKPEMKM